MLSDAERALLAAHKAERDAETELEREMAHEIMATHRPTVEKDAEWAPGVLCADDYEPYPCRRVQWAEKRRLGVMAVAAQRLGNGHQPDDA